MLEPFGKGNTKPVFAERHFKVIKAAVLGKNHNVLKMSVCDERHTMMEAMYFGDIEAFNTFIAGEYGKDAVEAMYLAMQTISIWHLPIILQSMNIEVIKNCR